jgi:intein/homing endonuclease
LKVTDVHPFYVRKSATSNDYAWTKAKDLKVGDMLLMSDGNLVKIDKINHYNNQETVYNLEVADNHNYFVDK